MDMCMFAWSRVTPTMHADDDDIHEYDKKYE